MADEQDVSKRYKTLPLSWIDGEYLASEICKQWTESNNVRDDMLSKREDWTTNWRDLNIQRTQGPWENSSDFHIPITLIDGKAIHARLWQLFSDLTNFFGVKARKEAFEDKEIVIKEFMTFILTDWANSKQGVKDVFDEWLWDVVFEGSGYLKLYHQRDVHEYLEVVPQVSTQEISSFDPETLTGRTTIEAKISETDQVRKEIIDTPQIKRILMEDLILPVGEGDPQTSRWVQSKVYMTGHAMKARAAEGKFDSDAVAEALKYSHNRTMGSNESEIKRTRDELDGYSEGQYNMNEDHALLEWYGKAYVEPEHDDESITDMDKMPKEIVVWVHQASRKVLGWTYLYRVSPSGMRPIFKADFIRFPDRSHGVGVPEVLAPIQQAIDATYNLRMDNGIMASTPFGFYRSTSGLKPDKVKIEPATMIPVDDPQGDVRIVQMPYLAGFGTAEEERLNGYAERVLTISDIQFGRTPSKVGAFRTASGSSTLQSESGIQLEIHFDRLARTLSRLLQALFRLTRERMPETFFYRITGENGEPIFGKVNRDDLRGEFDFEINVDILGESRIEAQQKAVLMMQTLINPAFTNTGVITPSNLYQMARNFLIKNRVRRVDNFVSKPQDYQGDIVTPSERVFRIVVNNYKNPPIEQTVRLGEDHAKAIEFYDSFQASDDFGLLTTPDQLAAFNRLKDRHNQMMMAQAAGSNPNMSGMQTPREGFGPMEAAGQPGQSAPSQGPLGAPQGEANGPVV